MPPLVPYQIFGVFKAYVIRGPITISINALSTDGQICSYRVIRPSIKFQAIAEYTEFGGRTNGINLRPTVADNVATGWILSVDIGGKRIMLEI